MCIYLFGWKFGNFSLRREGMAASSLEFFLKKILWPHLFGWWAKWHFCAQRGHLARFQLLVMWKCHPQRRCPWLPWYWRPKPLEFTCLNLPQAMESCRYGSKFMYEKRPRILVTFSIDKSHFEVLKNYPPRKWSHIPPNRNRKIIDSKVTNRCGYVIVYSGFNGTYL